MPAGISTGDGVDEAAVEMRVVVIGNHVQNRETHGLVLQHVHARSEARGEEEERGEECDGGTERRKGRNENNYSNSSSGVFTFMKTRINSDRNAFFSLNIQEMDPFFIMITTEFSHLYSTPSSVDPLPVLPPAILK